MCSERMSFCECVESVFRLGERYFLHTLMIAGLKFASEKKPLFFSS